MSQPWHSMFTDSEEESESTTSVHARYENKPPGKSSTASTPASVETPSQQHLSPLDSDATPTPDTTQDNVPALAPQQGGCDALGYSFAKLISSLTDALNACCGTSPPPAPHDRNTDPGGKDGEVSEATELKNHDTEKPVAGETAKKDSVGDSTRSRSFLDDLAMDHRSPAELLAVELRDSIEKEMEEKLLQYRMLWQAGELSDPAALDYLEKEKEELQSTPLTALSPPFKEKENTVEEEKFAVHLVHVSPYEPATPVTSDEQATEPSSNGESTSEDDTPSPPPDAATSKSSSTPATQQDAAKEHDAAVLGCGEGGGFEDGVEEGKQEVHVEEVVDAARKAGAVGDTRVVAPSYLPKDVVQKIPDVPKDTAGAAVSPESEPVPPRHAHHAAGTQDTELVFRYKTSVGLTMTLLFLAAVVVSTVAIGQLAARNGQSESFREATTLLSLPEWNKSDNGRAQLMIPEEETEWDILTLDIT
ncbi:hypothetical protein HPB51_002436 [Rhipicephalus microplus]|uniref:Transmembrane protein n=1 Tax=Rhipicephalus microplus TaxID=6941 RepID=A0A9J6DED3_RHIMP|nr:hypothetical protein HPB51_002436 [Rhipicephalus microplus]